MEEKEITTLVEYNALESTLTDLATRAQAFVEPNKEIQKELQKTRTRIEKIGKFLREDFTRMGKEVIAKEKQLIGIIEPEEKRLKLLQEEADFAIEKKYRESQYEARNARIEPLGLIFTPERNIELSDTEFESFFQERVADVNAAKEAELKAREDSIKQAEIELQRAKDLETAKETARAEERARSEREAVYAKEKAERDLAEANERAERAAQVERDRIAKQEAWDKKVAEEQKAKLEADIMYQAWLESHGWDDSITFHIERNGSTVRLYKLVDILEI